MSYGNAKESENLMARTYIPALIRTLKRVCVYIVRYRTQIEAAAGSVGITDITNKLNAVVEACDALVSDYEPVLGE